MHQIFFNNKFFTINTLWIFIVIAIISGTYAVIFLSKKNSLKLQFLSDNSFILIIYSIIGARVVSIIENYQTFFYSFSKEAFLQFFYIWDKGLNIWGGVITFIIAFLYLCKKNERDFFKWMDAIVPAVMVGMAISHLGAFFEGINYGSETSLPWGVNFDSPAIKYTVPIHPTQIYAAIYTALIAIGLFHLFKSEKIENLKKHGFIATIGIFSYNLMRFLEEFVRGDDTWLIFGIRMPQITALLITITSGIYLYKRYNKEFKFTFKVKKRRTRYLK